MKIKFCGAAREVTGSTHLITLEDGYTILMDCGMYQGHENTMKDFNEKWLFDPKTINCLLLSHAHIDHCGRIPRLVKDGFTGMIYCTNATRDLTTIMLLDGAGIHQRDAEYANKDAIAAGREATQVPFYTADDVRASLKLFLGFNYDNWITIRPGVEVLFRDAGHILGSASITLRVTENGVTKMIGFSGDIGRPNRPILNDPMPMENVEYLLCESTYGDKLHAAPPNEIEALLKVITDTCITKRGKIIIPAFSLGRTQELVYILDELVEQNRMPPVPVYVDSPLAVEATDIFIQHPECFDKEMHDLMLKDPDPFGFKNLTYIRDVEASKKLNTSPEPCIIISSSGMANAGRVKHHLANNIANKKNTVLIVGYASPDTPAGILRDGGKYLWLFGQKIPVNCDVQVMDSFSAHGDYKEMLDFIANQKTSVKTIFLVHGDYPVQQIWEKTLNANGFPNIQIPSLGDEVTI